MNILLTGANGFIAQNLKLRLSTIPSVSVVSFTHHDSFDSLHDIVSTVDLIFHLAATNRSDNSDDFQINNIDLTKQLASAIESVHQSSGRAPSVFFSSSIHVISSTNSDYGRSKSLAENILTDLSNKIDLPLNICRLPNVYGKFSRPFYNSLIATLCFCYANDHDLPDIRPGISFNAVYIDDLVDLLIDTYIYKNSTQKDFDSKLKYHVHSVNIDRVIEILSSFRNTLSSTSIPYSSAGLSRRLHAMFVSYLPSSRISSEYPVHSDLRGDFCELFKDSTFGQLSFFTCKPGYTRGLHFHDTKVERFVAVSGCGYVRSHNPLNGSTSLHSLDSTSPSYVYTVPGHVHSVTNTSAEQDLVVVVWCNETYDKLSPDTYTVPGDVTR